MALGTAVTGCGGGPKIVPAKGKVLLDGEPLQFGSVMFQPESGGQPARSAVKSDGTFTLGTEGTSDGATVGVNRVRVTCYESQGPSFDHDPNTERPLGKLLIPKRYTDFDTSGLKVDIKPKDNDAIVLELTSDP